MKYLKLLFVLSCVLVAGCDGTTSYNLQISVSMTESVDSVTTNGEVILGGTYSEELQFSGVQLEIWENGSVTQTISLGTISADHPQANFSFEASNPPDQLRIRYQDKTPEGAEGGTMNLEWLPEEGVYGDVWAENPEMEITRPN